MKVLQRTDKVSKKGEKMWSVQLDDNRWYDAYKFADEYKTMAKGAYQWAVPMESGGVAQQKDEVQKERSVSIERQNACRHTATIVASFIQARPALSTKEVDALVRHYYELWHDIITGKEGGELG
jgi:hypothetical protein